MFMVKIPMVNPVRFPPNQHQQHRAVPRSVLHGRLSILDKSTSRRAKTDKALNKAPAKESHKKKYLYILYIYTYYICICVCIYIYVYVYIYMCVCYVYIYI